MEFDIHIEKIGEKTSICFYFFISFTWSWIFWFPLVLASAGLFFLDNILFWILFRIGIFGPFIGAFLLTYLNEGKAGIVKLWKKFWNLKIELKWLGVVFLLFPLIIGLAFLLALLTENHLPELVYFSHPWLIFLDFIIIFFIGGPFNEEFGWRGYALERFQNKWSDLSASIILGVLWGFWHLPLFYITGSSQEGVPFIPFVIMTAILSVLFTWVYNNTDKNILAVMIFHCMFNLSLGIFPVQSTLLGIYYMGGLLLITALIVLIVYGPRKFIRNH